MAQFEGGYLDAYLPQRPSDVHDGGTGNVYSSRTYDANTLRSFTLLQFKKGQEATHGSDSDSLWIDGSETNNVVVIGEIMEITKHTAVTKYLLDDGTDVVTVKSFKQKKHDAPLGVEDEEEGLEKGKWVMVHGHYRPLADESFCNAFDIRPITDFNEVTFHFAKCIQQHLYFTRGPPPSRNATQTPNRPSMGNESVRRVSFGPQAAVGAATQSSSELTGAIRGLLEGRGELHVDEICRRLEDEFGKRKIRDAVKEMADSGQLYMGSSDDAYMWSG